MDYMLTKKTALVSSFLLTICLIFWDYIGNYKLCDLLTEQGHAGDCPFMLANIEYLLMPILFFLPLAFITYFMREEIYKAWFRFARWWIPLSIALIFLSPEYSSDWILPIEKGSVALTTSILFVCISIIVIALKYWRLNRRS